jgi:hypothetical protein
MSDGGFEQMSESTLIPELEEEPIVSRGHGVAALGPSDTSDSGSDITGGPGLAATGDFLELGGGTTSDLDVNQGHGSAGADIGETASAGRDTSVADGSDIGVDRIVSGAELGIGANSELIDEPDEQGHRRN